MIKYLPSIILIIINKQTWRNVLNCIYLEYIPKIKILLPGFESKL